MRDDQRGSLTLEQLAWTTIGLLIIVLVSAFVPLEFISPVVNTQKDMSYKTFSTDSLACPKGMTPVIIAKGSSPQYVDGNGRAIYKANSPTYSGERLIMRPAEHYRAGSFYLESDAHNFAYICAIDTNDDQIPDTP